MRKFHRVVLFIAVCLNPALVTVLPDSAFAGQVKPGVERQAVKIMPPEAGEASAVALIDLLAMPNVPGVRHNDERYSDRRLLGYAEGEPVITEGYLWLAAAEDDGDYHLQLAATNTSGQPAFICEIPSPAFVTDTALKAQVTLARAKVLEMFKGHPPSSAGTLLRVPRHVRVMGATFDDTAHLPDCKRGKKGMISPTCWEIHPVVSVEAIP